jgi:hypothetical protein
LRHLRPLLCGLCLILLASFGAQAQERKQKALEAVPEHLRARLVERLDLYVEYERTKSYEKLYDLLLESMAAPHGLTREGYRSASEKAIGEGRRKMLLKFKPTWTVDLSDEAGPRYQIFGRAKVSDGKQAYESEAAIEARWVNGDWYFSSLGEVLDD